MNFGIISIANPSDGFQKEGKPFKGIIFALNRNKKGGGSGENIDCKKSERWGRVNDDIIEVVTIFI